MEVVQVKESEQFVLDLGAHRRGELTESLLTQMGAKIKFMISAMFGGSPINAMLRGNRREIQSFTDTITKEKKYMDAYMRYGLDNPKTHKSRYALQGAIAKFERATKLKWPFK
jgi:hypothetical protein